MQEGRELPTLQACMSLFQYLHRLSNMFSAPDITLGSYRGFIKFQGLTKSMALAINSPYSSSHLPFDESRLEVTRVVNVLSNRKLPGSDTSFYLLITGRAFYLELVIMNYLYISLSIFLLHIGSCVYNFMFKMVSHDI